MKEIYKEGIIYIEDSEIVNLVKFGGDHLDCAFICSDFNINDSTGKIVAYTEKKEYAEKLRQIFLKDYKSKGCKYSLGIPSSMVNSDDLYI